MYKMKCKYHSNFHFDCGFCWQRVWTKMLYYGITPCRREILLLYNFIYLQRSEWSYAESFSGVSLLDGTIGIDTHIKQQKLVSNHNVNKHCLCIQKFVCFYYGLRMLFMVLFQLLCQSSYVFFIAFFSSLVRIWRNFLLCCHICWWLNMDGIEV